MRQVFKPQPPRPETAIRWTDPMTIDDLISEIERRIAVGVDDPPRLESVLSKLKEAKAKGWSWEEIEQALKWELPVHGDGGEP